MLSNLPSAATHLIEASAVCNGDTAALTMAAGYGVYISIA